MTWHPIRPEYQQKLDKILISDVERWIWAYMTDWTGGPLWAESLQLAQAIHDYIWTNDVSKIHDSKRSRFESDVKGAVKTFIEKKGRWCPLTEYW